LKSAYVAEIRLSGGFVAEHNHQISILGHSTFLGQTNMYRLLIGAAISLAATSSYAADYVQQQPVSTPHISGNVEAYLGGIWVDVSGPIPGGDENGWAAGGAGRINFPLNERWNIQTDALFDSVRLDDAG